MRAIRIHVAGEERKLVMEDVPKPESRPDQVLVRVQAIGVNRADLGRGAAGGQPGEPVIPGLDAGGTVEAIGSEVTGWRVGDPVIALVRGAYAEYCPSRAVLAYRPPNGMSITDAASIPCVFLTAWYALTKLGRLKSGETALVHSAGSGVGTAAIQIAKALGVRVLTSAGSDAKVARGLELGAEAGVNYSTQDVASELNRLTGGRGVDVVLDPVGGPIFDATLRALAPGGRVVTVGGPAGPRSEVDQKALEDRGQRVQAMGVFNEAAEDIEGKGWAQLKSWFESGTMRPVVHQVLPWTQAEAAQRLLSDRAIFGKIVLTLD
ncbi:MAG: hypothetical protein HW403_516 [Dehalococcoidia bacterium]|nr:hypothetical protein [Dehalococcoidia bacterium]